MMIPQVVSDYWTAKLHDLPDDGLQTVSGDEIAFALLKWLEELIGCDESEERSTMTGLSVGPKMGVFRNTVEKQFWREHHRDDSITNFGRIKECASTVTFG